MQGDLTTSWDRNPGTENPRPGTLAMGKKKTGWGKGLNHHTHPQFKGPGLRLEEATGAGKGPEQMTENEPIRLWHDHRGVRTGSIEA